MMHFSAWAGRYSRRRNTIDGSYGQLADKVAQQALVARQRARDSAEREMPDWSQEVRQMIEMALGQPLNGFDAPSLGQPHGYGPSLRTLWAAAQRFEYSQSEAWQHILAWARHRPAAWEVEDRRKKKGLAHTTPALGALLARELTWEATDEVEYPWGTMVEGERWQVRLNDFPDDFMYSLVIEGAVVGDFHDWSETWRRE